MEANTRPPERRLRPAPRDDRSPCPLVIQLGGLPPCSPPACVAPLALSGAGACRLAPFPSARLHPRRVLALPAALPRRRGCGCGGARSCSQPWPGVTWRGRQPMSGVDAAGTCPLPTPARFWRGRPGRGSTHREALCLEAVQSRPSDLHSGQQTHCAASGRRVSGPADSPRRAWVGGGVCRAPRRSSPQRRRRRRRPHPSGTPVRPDDDAEYVLTPTRPAPFPPDPPRAPPSRPRPSPPSRPTPASTEPTSLCRTFLSRLGPTCPSPLSKGPLPTSGPRPRRPA